MKPTLLVRTLTLFACNSKPKYEQKATGIRVTREPNGRIVSVPDSSRRDSF